jgi:hypothetical protein
LSNFSKEFYHWLAVSYNEAQRRTRLGDVAVFENRQPVTAAKFITKS